MTNENHPCLSRRKIDKMILICIKEQKLMLIQDNYKIAEYPISTSKFGIGNKSGSNMTPLGYHLEQFTGGKNYSVF